MALVENFFFNNIPIFTNFQNKINTNFVGDAHKVECILLKTVLDTNKCLREKFVKR